MSLRLGCSSPTYYVCLSCKKPACNKSKNCSVPTSEATTGWKAGVSVGYCADCSNKANSATSEEKAKGTKVKTDKTPGTKEETHSTRKCLTLGQKVEVICAFQNHRESTWKLAKRFECGKTQIIKILKNKESILEAWSSNSASNCKRSNNKKFEKINRLLWKWYMRARQSNIPVDGPMLREEARLIAEKLGETSFKGTDGWLAKWKQRHNVAQMSVAGEKGDVCQDTLESWRERVKELLRGFEPADI